MAASSMHLSKLRRWFVSSPPIEWALSHLRELLIGALREGPIPQHVAFVMDGNRRFARNHQIERVEGHHLGFEALAKVWASLLFFLFSFFFLTLQFLFLHFSLLERGLLKEGGRRRSLEVAVQTAFSSLFLLLELYFTLTAICLCLDLRGVLQSRR